MSSPLRGLLLAERHGVLATLAVRRQGWPFASLTAYALSASCEPLLLLSDLAEHTRNLQADPRASLLVQDASLAREDPQAGARVTLLGTVARVTDRDVPGTQARYIERHPQAAEYFGLSDFRLYILHPTEARMIGGFADAGWLTGEELGRSLAG